MFELIQAKRGPLAIARACHALGVSKSGYYRWAKSSPSARDKQDAALADVVRQIHSEHKGRYGSPRVHRELQARGHRVSRKRVVRLMQQEGLRGRTPRRFRRTTDTRHNQRVAPNLLARDFTAWRANFAWVGDMTYVPTSDGWLYLAVLIDLFSRRVVGWALSERIDTQLALGSLYMAVEERRPPPDLIHHTDRDCRYASDDYQAALKRFGMRTSMSRKADCWDNAVAESFFATLEKELLATDRLQPRARMRVSIAEYIDNYYNGCRRHSYVDYTSPIEFELAAS